VQGCGGARERGSGGEKGELSIVIPFVASGLAADVAPADHLVFVTSGLASVIPAKAGIQSNSGSIQILAILWIPDQVRHDEMHRHSGEPSIRGEGEKTVVIPFVASGLAPDVVFADHLVFVASGLVSVIPAKAGIQSNSGCIQMLPILWMPPYQVRGRPC